MRTILNNRSKIIVEKAQDISIVDPVKSIADIHRLELGFHSRQSFLDSLNKDEILVARYEGDIVGFVRYHHRKDKRTTIYEIAILPKLRGKGVGGMLVGALIEECRLVGSRQIRLSCPVELPANNFYEAMGFIRTTRRSQAGKNRPLYEWGYPILPARPITFVASLTASTNDIKHIIRIWEAKGVRKRPFDRCIITPLFIEAGAFEYVKYMHDEWGVKVIFDSGGYFVQQGKIRYDELFTRLLNFYVENQWAEVYVLPDFVPTSRHSIDEVTERVHVTAAEGTKFFNRLSDNLRSRAMGVLQGHTPEHLKHCFDAYLEMGLQRIGFGSFDTSGVKAEINLLTNIASQRLSFLRELLCSTFIKGQIEMLPDLHLFGVSSPNIIERFPGYLATSFDSSGWIRTAGFGNVYLPFQGRRNVTHGASRLLNGSGLSAAEFYTECERTNHSCRFCCDFSEFQKDRFLRMLHNAIVFSEMTDALNERMHGRAVYDFNSTRFSHKARLHT